jgi:alpha-tubulin suppressor-like RCC1 family protein
VEVGAGDVHSCGVASDGVAYCWGSNANGQLGQGAISGAALTPLAVAASESFAKISAHGAHTCAITADAEAYCWGDNSVGQLGNGSTSVQLEPAPVSGNLGFVEISVGGMHTCAVATSKALYCWGYNNHAQGGDGTFTQREVPTLVTTIAGSVESVAAGMIHSCATTSAGTGYCWGANFDGRVGDGTVSDREVPTQVSGDLSFTQIAAGEFHSCGLTQSGVLYCWGFNAWGQLGDGTDQSSLVPKRVAH